MFANILLVFITFFLLLKSIVTYFSFTSAKNICPYVFLKSFFEMNEKYVKKAKVTFTKFSVSIQGDINVNEYNNYVNICLDSLANMTFKLLEAMTSKKLCEID